MKYYTIEYDGYLRKFRTTICAANEMFALEKFKAAFAHAKNPRIISLQKPCPVYYVDFKAKKLRAVVTGEPQNLIPLITDALKNR